jgi:hypothetical protein
MRLALWLLGSAITAGTGTAGVKEGIIPVPVQMALAVRALGGDSSQIRTIDLKSLRATYDEVMRRVTSQTAVAPSSEGQAQFSYRKEDEHTFVLNPGGSGPPAAHAGD